MRPSMLVSHWSSYFELETFPEKHIDMFLHIDVSLCASYSVIPVVSTPLYIAFFTVKVTRCCSGKRIPTWWWLSFLLRRKERNIFSFLSFFVRVELESNCWSTSILLTRCYWLLFWTVIIQDVINRFLIEPTY